MCKLFSSLVAVALFAMVGACTPQTKQEPVVSTIPATASFDHAKLVGVWQGPGIYNPVLTLRVKSVENGVVNLEYEANRSWNKRVPIQGAVFVARFDNTCIASWMVCSTTMNFTYDPVSDVIHWSGDVEAVFQRNRTFEGTMKKGPQATASQQ